jgi:hypothetical protein
VAAHTISYARNYRKAKEFYMAASAPLVNHNNMKSEESAGISNENTDFWISQADKGAPGYRDYSPGYYAAFILDPDGDDIETV